MISTSTSTQSRKRRLISLACAVAVLGMGLLAFGGPAFATPVVTFKAAFVPIAGGSGPTTSGAMMHLEYAISGSEYQGEPPPPTDHLYVPTPPSPPPLIGLNLILPDGVELHPEGFPGCPAETAKKQNEDGAAACPQESQAGPAGSALGVFSLGYERIRENIVVQPYFAPGGNLGLYLRALSPAAINKIAGGSYANLDGGGGEGPEIGIQLPLVASLPGALEMSIEGIDLSVGVSRTAGGRTISYVTLPGTCPNAGFPVKTELVFAGLGGLAQQTVTQESDASCPVGSEPSSVVAGTDGIVTMPSNRVCLSRGGFTIHVRRMKGLKYRRVSVAVNGRRVAVVRGTRASADVHLRGLSKGRYVVEVAVTASTGRRIIGARVYHTCGPTG